MSGLADRVNGVTFGTKPDETTGTENQGANLTQEEINDLKDASNDSIVTDVAEGVVVGAGVGAVVGGIVGSIVPGAGTVAGAALGAKAGAWIGGAAPVFADVAEGAWDGLCSLGHGARNVLGAIGDGCKATWSSLWD